MALTLTALQEGRLGEHETEAPAAVREAARFAQKGYLGLYERPKQPPSPLAAPHMEALLLADALDRAHEAFAAWEAMALTTDDLRPWLEGLLCACCDERFLHAITGKAPSARSDRKAARTPR